MLKKQQFLFFVFATNALLYSLVYFFPVNNYGEPQIPIILKLIFDFFSLGLLVVFGLKRKMDDVRLTGLFFLIIIVLVGILHIPHTSIADYLHFTIRNICFYALLLFVDYYPKINKESFRRFHEGLFKFILIFGLILFTLQKAGVPNPFPFKTWLWEGNRLITSWLNPNSLGFYLIFYLFYFYSKYGRLIPLVGLIIISIFLTGSITAIIGTILFLIFLLLKFFSSKKLKASYILAILILLPAGAYFAVSLGALDYILFKIDVLFIKKEKIYTSVSTRIENINDLIVYLRPENILSILLGDFNTDTYRRLDSQYLNVFYNYGLIGLMSYLVFLISVFLKLKNHLNNEYSRAFFLLSIWLYLVAFNLTAYLYRPNVAVFYYLMLVYTLSNQKKQTVFD